MSESEQSISTQSTTSAPGHTWGTWLAIVFFVASSLLALLQLLNARMASASANGSIGHDMAQALFWADIFAGLTSLLCLVIAWQLYRLKKSVIWLAWLYFLVSCVALVAMAPLFGGLLFLWMFMGWWLVLASLVYWGGFFFFFYYQRANGRLR